MSLDSWIALAFFIVGLVFFAFAIAREFSWKNLLFAVVLGGIGVLFLKFRD